MTLQKNDFIEIEFTGKIKNSNEVFDSNKKEELEKLHSGHNHKIDAKTLIYPLGQDMFLKGVDDFLIGKESENFPMEYKIELTPEKAFGKRNPKEVQMIPIKIFKQHNIQPIPGHSLNFDNKVGKILTVSGGRVMVDFNNALSGKDVVYEIKILRKIDDIKEKIKSLNEFLFRQNIEFEIKNKKLILEIPKQMNQFAELFKDKFKEILDLELEVKEVPEKKEEKK